MAKSRKTREQKIAATQKHQQTAQQVTYSLSTQHVTKQNSPQVKPASHIYAYTNKDLQKTFLISTSLIIFELILFFLLHQHILKIPLASY